jgi:hypothetical protein
MQAGQVEMYGVSCAKGFTPSNSVVGQCCMPVSFLSEKNIYHFHFLWLLHEPKLQYKLHNYFTVHMFLAMFPAAVWLNISR